MHKLTREDLYTLEDYADTRADMRARVMAHKNNRRVELGQHISLLFEDRFTMHYQIQEMLRAERIFEAAGIQEELDAYNPLIPDGSNWKATMMIQYADVEQRRQALAELIDLEQAVWVKIGAHERVRPICDEDLERTTEEKTSSVHFLRFELDAEMIADLKAGTSMAVGVDHPYYRYEIDPLPAQTTQALLADLD
ncbi:MAG: DUF3501 family protein [Gammaproteobacteria bacterium]|nr:DUF3501 family protein [Gammaproteobacteria bacterium]